MIKTVVDQNEHDVYYLHIYDGDSLIFESYNDRDEMALHEMANLAIQMYELGRDQAIDICADNDKTKSGYEK